MYSWRRGCGCGGGGLTVLQGAIRTLQQAAGVNMNTWFVGNVPIGHLKYKYPATYTADAEAIGKKVFFMKARIMAGQADLANNTMELEDFAWLTKEEIKKVVMRKYYDAVEGILVSQ